MAYTPTSGRGLQLLKMRYLFASSVTFQARCGVESTAEALPFVLLEDPFQSEQPQPTLTESGLVLPQIKILSPIQASREISGGIQPVLWPEADYAVAMWFWPSLTYHTGEDESIQDEVLEAEDFVGNVDEEIRALQGLDITIGDDTYALPSLGGGSRVDLYNSMTEDIARDLETDEQEYRYFYFAQWQLKVQP